MFLFKNLIIFLSLLKIFNSFKIDYLTSNKIKNTTKFNYFINNGIRRDNELKRSLRQNNTNLYSNENDNGNSLQFIISKVDIDSESDSDYSSNSLSTIPIILPAQASLTLPSGKSEKIKKNFSKLGKSLIINSSLKSKNKKLSNETNKLSDTELLLTSITTKKINSTTTKKPIDLSGFCFLKTDGLYDDPEDCENFVICFANRTFRTKCAYGTLWNHVRKECDYPEKVDCNRLTTTIETTVVTTKSSPKPTTRLIKPKLSFVTSKPTLVQKEESKGSSISNNILIASILIPGIIILIVAIILTLWYWNKKFKLQSKILQTNRTIETNLSKEESSKLTTNNTNQILLSKISSCCCYKKLSNLAANHKQFKPKMINSTNIIKEDRVRSQPNLAIKETAILANPENSQITITNQTLIENKGFIQESPDTIVLSECKMADASHATLSSHFEDNNWDYNFATRGLYLSQPWIRGKYVHTLGSESIATSAVLTLDPTTEISGEINANKLIEICGDGGSDTDGYYA